MKALVYKGPGQSCWDEMPDPKIEQPTDVIVQMVATTICGTDLHILKGDVPEVEIGRILGHEGIGVITDVGDSVTQLGWATESYFRVSVPADDAPIVEKGSTATARIPRALRGSDGSSAT